MKITLTVVTDPWWITLQKCLFFSIFYKVVWENAFKCNQLNLVSSEVSWNEKQIACFYPQAETPVCVLMIQRSKPGFFFFWKRWGPTMLCSFTFSMLCFGCYILGRSCSHQPVGFGRYAFSAPVGAAQLGSQDYKQYRHKGKCDLAYWLGTQD